MSRLLKCVEYRRESPFQLKETNIPRQQNSPDKLKSESELIRQKIYENNAKKLVEEAMQKSIQIIEESKTKAAQILSNAQKEKQIIEQKAYEKGYREGLETAKREQQTAWDKHMKELHNKIREIESQNDVFKKYLEKQCLKLSLKIAEKILGEKLQNDGEYFLQLIRRGLEESGEESNILVRVSEDDYKRVEPLIDKLQNGARKITLIKDLFLTSGDCIIQGTNFEIDAGIHTQIKNLVSTLREMDVIEDDKEQK